MPRGSKPGPPSEQKRPDKVAHQWQKATAAGWKGRKPNPPTGLTDAGKKAWRSWFGSWWASFWTVDDLPALELVVKLYDGVLGGHVDVSKLTPLLDRYGITPKGRQDLRWLRPEGEEPATEAQPDDELAARRKDRKLA